ncbi:hypothetical protein C8T65DRAFT_282139 [Cerioporus squamosus]|nr:hypothetical protein C8T65DRAFT_282139 [Cerioporus squamosus]
MTISTRLVGLRVLLECCSTLGRWTTAVSLPFFIACGCRSGPCLSARLHLRLLSGMADLRRKHPRALYSTTPVRALCPSLSVQLDVSPSCGALQCDSGAPSSRRRRLLHAQAVPSVKARSRSSTSQTTCLHHIYQTRKFSSRSTT